MVVAITAMHAGLLFSFSPRSEVGKKISLCQKNISLIFWTAGKSSPVELVLPPPLYSVLGFCFNFFYIFLLLCRHVDI